MKTILALSLCLFALPSFAALKGESVAYEQGGAKLEGYLVYDDAVKGPRPGVVVFHEWWGFGPYVKGRAEELARLGYVAFAADMYGKGVYTKDHTEAGKLAGAFNQDREKMRARARAAFDVLAKNPNVNAAKIAAMGYCFGGASALELARSGAPLVAAASFHGGVDTPKPETTKPFKAKILAMIGADDKWLTPGIPKFEEEMKRLNVDYEVILFGHAVHSFTVPEAGNDPSKGMAYDAAADRRSHEALRALLAEAFR